MELIQQIADQSLFPIFIGISLYFLFGDRPAKYEKMLQENAASATEKDVQHIRKTIRFSERMYWTGLAVLVFYAGVHVAVAIKEGSVVHSSAFIFLGSIYLVQAYREQKRWWNSSLSR